MIYRIFRFQELIFLKTAYVAFTSLLFLSLIHEAFIENSFEQIWSIPVLYLTNGVADLSWNTSTSIQIWNYDVAVLEILTDPKF